MTQRVHPYRIQLYRTRLKWRYRILAGNHKIVKSSNQGYWSKSYCRARAVEDLNPQVLEGNGGPGYTVETEHKP